MLLNQICRKYVKVRYEFFKQSLQFSKMSSFYSDIKRKPFLLRKTEYKLIYNFPYIYVPAGIIKSGTANVLLTIASSPFFYYYYGSATPCLLLFGGACVHLVMSIGFSKFFRNIVGKIYTNKEGEVKDVIISSVDKFGRRIDRIHHPNELINCEYLTKATGQLGFIQISVENSDLHYKVNIRNCKIYDISIWENLFGRIPFPNLVKKHDIKVWQIKRID